MYVERMLQIEILNKIRFSWNLNSPLLFLEKEIEKLILIDTHYLLNARWG